PGGGVAFIRVLKAVDDLKLKGDEKVGSQIVRRALYAPIRQIAENAGTDGAIVAQKVEETDGPFGFNADTLEYTDLVEDGVIDPTKVARTALENAASVATLLLTTNAAISEIPEEKKEKKTPQMPPY
ncbi:MAG: TCP-1/cpn60 chaperonin family protein, partial [Planctomycetota bacterium]